MPGGMSVQYSSNWRQKREPKLGGRLSSKIEAEKEREQLQMELKMRQMELEAETARLASVPAVPEPSSPTGASSTFDISRQIDSLTKGTKAEIDSYLCVF